MPSEVEASLVGQNGLLRNQIFRLRVAPLKMTTIVFCARLFPGQHSSPVRPACASLSWQWHVRDSTMQEQARCPLYRELRTKNRLSAHSAERHFGDGG